MQNASRFYRLAVLLLFLSGMAMLPAQTGTPRDTQPPHDASNGIDCQDCHVPFGFVENPDDSWITQNVCQSCHIDGGMASFQRVHAVADTIWCQNCHNPHRHQDVYSERFIAENIQTPNSGSWDVAFRDSTDFVHGQFGVTRPFDGICEVCHTQTNYYRNNSSGDHTHHAGSSCIVCHKHVDGFSPTMATLSHSYHLTDTDGPQLVCSSCHSSNPPEFADFQNLSATTVCNMCHSPEGAYDGVDDPLVGAKVNWDQEIYQEGNLLPGKENWCSGCHDLGTSLVNNASAAPVAGDNLTWGYEYSGHGKSPAIGCTTCHDARMSHIDGIDFSYDAELQNYQSAFRLKDFNGGRPLWVPRSVHEGAAPYTDPPYYDLCISCHDKYALFGGPDAPAGPYYSTTFLTNFRSDSIVVVPDLDGTDIGMYSMGGAQNRNAHSSHVQGPVHFDSDRDGTGDSCGTCVSCHNVHGSTMPAMVRDGKLTGLEPGLNFSNVRYDRHSDWPASCIIMTSEGVTPTTNIGGVMRAGSTIPLNGICGGCHPGGGNTGDPEYIVNCFGPDPIGYYREHVEPPGPATVLEPTPVIQ